MHVRARRTAGAALWGAAFVVALAWGAFDSAGVEGTGYGFAPAVDVSALETARVMELPVHLHDAVGADQIVVRMDAAPIQEERQVALAQLLAVQEEAAQAALNDARRFAEGRDQVAVNRAKLAMSLQEDLALADTLRERLSIESDLAATGASSAQSVAEWQRQLRVVEARVVANRSALSVAAGATTRAEARNAELGDDGGLAETFVVTRQIEALEGRIARMELKAGIEGQVTWIYRAPGEVVPAGQPVLQVRPTGTHEVVAFVAPKAAVGLEAGEAATVKRATGQVVNGRLKSVGSGPQPLPAHLWKLPNWPEYGVPIVVDLDGEVGPDELVVVRI